MSDLDEGRDLRAALGGLLVGEPPAAWSVTDDVARGRALQRRRRTRAGAGVGLVAAAAMVLGVFGPWRPTPATVVPPAFQPPAVQGVDQEWLGALSEAFTYVSARAVDWSSSTVTATGGGGFRLDLSLVSVPVSTDSSEGVAVLPDVPGPEVDRARVTWSPTGGVGPVLAMCSAPACTEVDGKVITGFLEAGGYWTAAGDQVAGTVVVDRFYETGGSLELAASPTASLTADPGLGTVSDGWLSAILGRVGPPTTGPQITDDFGVTSLLNDLGWAVDRVDVEKVPEGSPSVTVWTVRKAGGDATASTGRLTIRAWDGRSWVPRSDGFQVASAISGCAAAGACSEIAYSVPGCTPGGRCWGTASATTAGDVLRARVGTYLLYASDDDRKLAVEAAVEPRGCGVAGDCPVGLAPFLSAQETAQVVEVVKKQLEAAPDPSPSPSTPGAPDAVTRVLEGFGFRVTLVAEDEPALNPSRTYTVNLNRRSNDPSTATLSLTSYPDSRVPIDTDRVDVYGAVLAGCTSTTCAPAGASGTACTSSTCGSMTRIAVPCPSDSCLAYWAATTKPAYAGVAASTLAMFRSDGTDGAEAVASVPTCPACGALDPASAAFLTVEQTQEVLNAFGYPGSAAPTARPTTDATACTNGEVKIVPAVDPAGGAAGERSFALEVYARNPSVSCMVEGFPRATLLVGTGTAPELAYTQGSYQLPNADRGVAVVVDETHAALFVVSKYRCDSGAVARADHVDVLLPGSPTSTPVELPPDLALELCGGGANDAGHQVWVSAAEPRAGAFG